MYTSFFGLAEKPFSITPDPRYLFLSERHAEALAHLVYGITESGGFIQLTGEVGTGKTTVVRSLLAQVPENADVALILNPRLSPVEFLQAICDELRVPLEPATRTSIKYLVDTLNAFLLARHARGRRVVVIVDEAQQLSPEVLEQVRLLTNLETETQKLLQIILIGQPELREVLARTDLRQLAQRITGRYHLDPLTREETLAYVRHRVKVAGAAGSLFTPAALKEVHRLSRGVPRVINVICDRALLGAFTAEENRVTPAFVRSAAGEVYGRPVVPPYVPWLIGGAVGAGLLLVIAGLWMGLHRDPAPPAAAAATVAAGQPAAAPADAATAGNAAAAGDAAALRVRRPRPLPAVLVAYAAETGTDTALSRLFARWGLRYDSVRGQPCVQAADAGLACATLKGSWAQLRQLNRPAVLAITDAAGTEHQVLVAEADGDTVQLALGDKPGGVTVGLSALTQAWYGEALLLWRPAFQPVRELSFGMRGPEVRSLRELLEQERGRPTRGPVPDTYDAVTQRLVEDFQRAQRLAVDGIAGVRTQMVLDSVVSTGDVPVLVRAAEAG